MYVLAPLHLCSRDTTIFPLLSAGDPSPYVQQDHSYPRSLHPFGIEGPLFSGGILSNAEIELIVTALAKKIRQRYQRQRLLIVALLDGAWPFFNRLRQELQGPQERNQGPIITLSTLKVRSYDSGTQAGAHRIVQPLVDLSGTEISQLDAFDHMLVLDDLVDSGATLFWLLERLFSPRWKKRIETCFLLEKEVSRKGRLQQYIDETTILIGRRVPDEWVVGFGLDLALENYAGQGCHLFRAPLPGGIYAFNKEIEKELTAAYYRNPQEVEEQLKVYLT